MASGWRLSFTDPNGNTWVLNDGITAWIDRDGLEGFDDVEKEIASSRIPYRHGVVAHGDPYSPQRVLSAAIYLMATNAGTIKAAVRARRSAVSPYKKSETPGILLVEDLDNSVSRSIECWCVAMREKYVGPSDRQLVYHFAAEAPFFYDPTEQVQTLAVSGGGVEFPITFPITFTETDIEETVALDNLGDAPTWPTIRVYGPGDNPSLDNTTLDKKVALTVTLASRDYVDIDMENGTVMMYDDTGGTTESIIETMSDDSQFWEMQVGENSVDVAMANAASGSIRISYYLQYLGI